MSAISQLSTIIGAGNKEKSIRESGQAAITESAGQLMTGTQKSQFT